MKNLLLIILLLLSINLRSQDLQFKGIGPFVIGSNLSEVMEKVSKTNGRYITGKSFTDVFRFHADTKPGVMRLMYDSTSTMNSQYCYGYPGEVDYTINFYEVAGIKIKDIYLIFLDSMLSGFVCKVDQDLKEAISLKYGEGNLVKKLDSVACRYSSTGNVKYEKTYTETATWTFDGGTATRYNTIDYDDKCKIKGYHTLTVETKGTTFKLLRYEMDQRKIRDERRKAIKKDSLKDF